MNFDLPNEQTDVLPNYNFADGWLKAFVLIRNTCVGITQYGPTAQRPTSNINIGTPYYDTTLGYQVCVHQVKPTIIWHNGAGAPV